MTGGKVRVSRFQRKSVGRSDGVSDDGFVLDDAVGMAWEWLEGNLGMRAAMAVAKMVEKGRVVELDGTLGVLWCDPNGLVGLGGRGWDFWTEWDENFWNQSHFCCLLHLFCTLMP